MFTNNSIYQISKDLEACAKLLEAAVDESGEPRELTAEEEEFLKSCFSTSYDEFTSKFDNYCKFIKNLKLSASNADSERKNYKEELDRLSRRAKAFENHAQRMNEALRFAYDTLNIKKYKTDLFSAGIQNTQLKINTLEGEDLSSIPEKFLKPRELNITAIKEAIKSGELTACLDAGLNYSHIFDSEGKALKGVRVLQGTALVIR